MEKNKIRICGAANRALMKLSGSTGLTPNVLARIGFCLSLKQPTPPDPEQYRIEGDNNVREFNRYTLFGNNGYLYMALLKQSMSLQKCSPDFEEEKLLLAHLNRGAILLSKSSAGLISLLNQ